MIKKISVYILLPLTLVVIYIYYGTQLDKNLDSIFDEGFLFLKIQAAQNGEIDGYSQWATFIKLFFGKDFCSNLLYLRLARYFTHLLSVSLFAIITAWYLVKHNLLVNRQKIICYISYVYLFGTLAIGGISISYNQLQEFFLIGAFLSFLLGSETKANSKLVFYFLSGFFSFFSILTILPSGILILFCLLALILIKEFKSGKIILIYFFSVSLGLLVAALFFHFIIIDLRIVFEKMTLTAHTITKLNRGYDPLSILSKIILYFRDFYIQISALLGAIALSALVMKYTNRAFASIAFLLSVIVFTVYFKKPEMPISTLLALPIILSLAIILFENSKILASTRMNFDVSLNIFLFFFPLISSIGTNTSLASKMIVFILPWSVLIVKMLSTDLIKEKYKKEIQFSYWFTILVIVLLPVKSFISYANGRNNIQYYFKSESGEFPIGLNKNQKIYFDKVYGFVKKYNYKTGDLFFATQLDHMTITVLSGFPCGIYFQPMDFLADEKKNKLHAPDFIFLTEYDSTLLFKTLHSLDWGFPQEFDSYLVGTPENFDPGYHTERTLYCRKSRKAM